MMQVMDPSECDVNLIVTKNEKCYIHNISQIELYLDCQRGTE